MLYVFPQPRLEHSEWESARTPIIGACGSQEQVLLMDLPGSNCRRVRGRHRAGSVPWEWASGVEVGECVGVQPPRRLSPRMPFYLEDGIRITGEGKSSGFPVFYLFFGLFVHFRPGAVLDGSGFCVHSAIPGPECHCSQPSTS